MYKIRPEFFYFLVLGSADPNFSKSRIKIKLGSKSFIFILSADRLMPSTNKIKARTIFLRVTRSACTNGRYGRIYARKFLWYAEKRHQRRPRTSKIVSVRRDLKGMSYISISFRMINSCQNMYIKCISL